MELRDYLNKAKKGKWAMGQFNFSTLEQLRGIMKAAVKMKSPVILGTSEGELKFLGIKQAVALVEILKLDYNIPAFLNLDHGKDLSLIKKAIDYGFSAVHFDGSLLSLEKNINYAKKVANLAHKKGLIVEGEIDDIKKKSLTKLSEAKKFVYKTKVDSLAIAIGSIHGYYKSVSLDFEALRELAENLSVYLVLHGGSGISNSQIKKAVKLGINKVNINTELRMAWKQGVEKGFGKKEIKPYKVLFKAEKAVQKKVEEKIKLFSSFNKI